MLFLNKNQQRKFPRLFLSRILRWLLLIVALSVINIYFLFFALAFLRAYRNRNIQRKPLFHFNAFYFQYVFWLNHIKANVIGM